MTQSIKIFGRFELVSLSRSLSIESVLSTESGMEIGPDYKEQYRAVFSQSQSHGQSVDCGKEEDKKIGKKEEKEETKIEKDASEMCAMCAMDARIAGEHTKKTHVARPSGPDLCAIASLPPTSCFPQNLAMQRKRMVSSTLGQFQNFSGETKFKARASEVIFEDSLEELENRLMEALRLQREEEVAVLQFNRWHANAIKTQIGIKPENGYAENKNIQNDARHHRQEHHYVDYSGKNESLQPQTMLPWPQYVEHSDASLLCYEDLTFCEKIGEGAFGIVFRSLLWGQEVAVKKLVPENKRPKGMDGSNPCDTHSIKKSETVNYKKLITKYMAEVQILSNLRHPNILNFMGIAFRPPNDLCIVTEYLPCGSLARLLKLRSDENKGPLPVSKVIRYAKDMARALNYLHHKGVIHRDLKPSNLLLDKSDGVKISDFGLSHFKKHNEINAMDPNAVGQYGICGTPVYMAPEIFQSCPYGTKTDVFSFAIVLAELLIGDYPYKHLDPFLTTTTFEAAIISGVRPLLPSHTPEPLRRLIESCWKLDPNLRPDFTHLLSWLSQVEESMQHLSKVQLGPRAVSDSAATDPLMFLRTKAGKLCGSTQPKTVCFQISVPPEFPLPSDITIASKDILQNIGDHYDLQVEDFVRLIADDKLRIVSLQDALERTASLLKQSKIEDDSLKRQAAEIQIENSRLESEIKRLAAENEQKDKLCSQQAKEIEMLKRKMEISLPLESESLAATCESRDSHSEELLKVIQARPKRLFLPSSHHAPRVVTMHHHHYDFTGFMLPSLYFANGEGEGSSVNVAPVDMDLVSGHSVSIRCDDPAFLPAAPKLDTIYSASKPINIPQNCNRSSRNSPPDSCLANQSPPSSRSIDIFASSSSVLPDSCLTFSDRSDSSQFLQFAKQIAHHSEADFSFASAIAPLPCKNYARARVFAPASASGIVHNRISIRAPSSEPHHSDGCFSAPPAYTPNRVVSKSLKSSHLVHHHFYHRVGADGQVNMDAFPLATANQS